MAPRESPSASACPHGCSLLNALVVLVLIVLIALITFVGRCQVRSAMDPARKCTCNVHTGEGCSRRDMLNVPCPHLGAACREAGVDVSKFVSPQETTAKWKEPHATAPKFAMPTGGTESVPWLTNPSVGTEMKLTASANSTVKVVCPPVTPNPAGRMSLKRKAACTNTKSPKRRLATGSALVAAAATVTDEMVAVAACEREQQLPPNTATVEQVAATSAGIKGYVNSSLGAEVRSELSTKLTAAGAKPKDNVTKAKRGPHCRKCMVHGHTSNKCSGLRQVVQGGFNFAQAAAEKYETDRLERRAN